MLFLSCLRYSRKLRHWRPKHPPDTVFVAAFGDRRCRFPWLQCGPLSPSSLNRCAALPFRERSATPRNSFLILLKCRTLARPACCPPAISERALVLPELQRQTDIGSTTDGRTQAVDTTFAKCCFIPRTSNSLGRGSVDVQALSVLFSSQAATSLNFIGTNFCNSLQTFLCVSHVINDVDAFRVPFFLESMAIHSPFLSRRCSVGV